MAMKWILLCLGIVVTANAVEPAPPLEKARFIVEPEIVVKHTPARAFIGPGMFLLENGDILMAAPWGRPPTNFEQLAAKFPVPMLYRSRDGGRTWDEQGRMKMDWSLSGMISDGGVSFLRLKDGRLAFVANRHVQGQHGGGLPVISFSKDDGVTWTPAQLIGEPEGAWYVMNDRLIQMRNGRLIVPAAHMQKGTKLGEGDKNTSRCFFSDDGGKTWMRSSKPAQLDDERGMAEPAVAEVDGGLLMLARTGGGFLYSSSSADGGDTWSEPQPTTLVSACSSLTLKTLPDGRLIVFYNHAAPLKLGAFFPRTPLCYAVSGDGGQSWSEPIIVDNEGMETKDRQNIYPSIAFTKEGMLVFWSTHQADPKGSFAGQYNPAIGGGKRAILAYPKVSESHKAATSAAEPAKPADVDGKSYDLVVVGATPGGIACAVRAAREGLSVLLVNHTQHLGGFVTSGAGGWEAPYDGLRSPLYHEMIAGAAAYYRDKYGEGSPQHILSMPSKTSRAHIDRPKIEPRIAELLFNQMVEREKSLTVLLGHIVAKAEREGPVLRSVTLQPMHGQGSITVRAKVFADAMYEGDLMAAAGVKTQIGRESRQQYNEPHAGVIYTSELHKEPGQRGFPQAADKGTLNIRYNPHATGEIVEGPHSGEADDSVMAYNYRLILTRDPANRIMVSKPANYDPAIAKAPAGASFVPNLPNNKVAWNGGRLVGPQNEYPGGDWTTREAISKRYLDGMLMCLWRIQNDPEAHSGEREQFAGYGLAADEFPDNHHLPYEIYVREARRLVGRYVFKEQDNIIAEGIARTPVHADSIAMTDWPMDSVACLPRTVPGGSIDGILFLAEQSRPAQVPYRSIVANEVENLLVPVAISASHVGYGSIRLEPVWMQLGESAGFAAALAVKGKTTPAALDPDLLTRKLATSRVTITFFNDLAVASDDPCVPAAQYFGTKGFFASYDAKLIEPLTEALRSVWLDGFKQLQQGTLDASKLAIAVHAAESKESPSTGEQRADFLLRLWKQLNGQTPESRKPTSASPPSPKLRILPLGDSVTRGSYSGLALKDGKAIGLPNPDGGGYRKPLQDRLRAAGVAFDFVGELSYGAFGREGVVDASFDPDHHGLAGFGNGNILTGGTVPTPADVLAALGAEKVTVPGIVPVLERQQPDIILLMSGTNGFDASARDKLIRTIGEHSMAHLFVATILPQKSPRAGWEKVDAYNASLPAIVDEQKKAGRRITLVDMHAAITADDLLPDGVHPTKAGMEKMAGVWFAAIETSLRNGVPKK